MCGIAGFLDSSRQFGADESTAVVTGMASALRHRGPDDAGAWVDAEAGIALGHRRLSIIDLSPEGCQPMHSSCGRYVIVFNGEIYNFEELRREVERSGYPFRGRSDTEVMLAAVSRWGLDEALPRFNGMFAFALWDRRERLLHLVRDRLGEKPLYYGWAGKTLLFGSELKALRAHPQFNGEIDRDALALYLRHNYIPAPHTIFRGYFKLPPGTVLTLKGTAGESKPVPYWSVQDVAERGVADPFTGSEDEAVAALDALLQDAVRLRMVADVPLGAFLSGGIDSSTIVALMQAQSDRPVKTFTIGFHEDAYNEAGFARAVAHHLGTEHTELYVTPEEAMAVIPLLPTLYDEPFSDSSQIPTCLLSKLARQYVTVVLSGDAGDELFGGYSRYVAARDLWDKVEFLPPAGRRALAGILSAAPVGLLNRILGGLSPLLGRYGRTGAVGDKLHKLAEVLSVPSPGALYRRLVSHWKEPASVVLGAGEPPTPFTEIDRELNFPGFEHLMMYLDTVTYLPDDILVKVDRASMGVSLEARIPLLDHRVVEFAWRLPLSMKITGDRGKHLLRRVLYQYVPPDLVERPKMGFGVPIDAWLRGPLREWAESLLKEKRLRGEGFFDPQPIREKWSEHLSGQRNWHYYLWDVLMFQAWLEEFQK